MYSASHVRVHTSVHETVRADRQARRHARYAQWQHATHKVTDLLTRGYDTARSFTQQHKRRLAASAGAMVLTACLGGVAEGTLQITSQDSTGFRTTAESPMHPMSATDNTMELTDPNHDPNAYTELDLSSVETATTSSLHRGLDGFTTLELSLSGLAGAGALLYRRWRSQEPQPYQTVVEACAAPTDLAQLRAMFAEQDPA